MWKVEIAGCSISLKKINQGRKETSFSSKIPFFVLEDMKYEERIVVFPSEHIILLEYVKCKP